MWNGYGRATFEDRTQNAHRVAYVLTHGAIAVGLHVDHLCRNRLCCNPAHLDAVTARENLHRSPAMIARVSKTHCPAGHAYSGSNLRVYASGRQCRTCGTVAQGRLRRRRAEREGRILRAPNAGKSLCLRGHTLSGENLYRRPDGDRECRACMRIRAQRVRNV